MALAALLAQFGLTQRAPNTGFPTGRLAPLGNPTRHDRLRPTLPCGWIIAFAMSGLVFHDKAKEDRPELKYLFMSGYAELPARGLPEGTELLKKPFELNKLAQQVRATLDT